MFDYGTPTYLRSYGAAAGNYTPLANGYWFDSGAGEVYENLEPGPGLVVVYSPMNPEEEGTQQEDAGIATTRARLAVSGRYFKKDRASAVAYAKKAQATYTKTGTTAPAGSGMRGLTAGPQKAAAPVAAPTAPAAPTYVPVPTSPSTALVPAPGKTGGATAGLTQKPWFWPAVAGGGILVLFGLFAAFRGKKSSTKASTQAPAAPSSRFKF